MSAKPTSRELRILRNLADKNAIWESLGRKHFVQFDELTGTEMLVRRTEIDHLTASGWIRLVQLPKSAQRLDHYELTTEGASLEGMLQRKMPKLELEPLLQLSRRRRA